VLVAAVVELGVAGLVSPEGGTDPAGDNADDPELVAGPAPRSEAAVQAAVDNRTASNTASIR
jgi:hypothetical protein